MFLSVTANPGRTAAARSPEQRHRGGIGILPVGYRQRADPDHLLAGNAEAGAAGGEHGDVRRRGEHGGDECSGTVENVFAVVHDEQRRACPEELHNPPARSATSWMARPDAAAALTEALVSTSASSITKVPSGYWSAVRAAACNARRVVPMPPRAGQHDRPRRRQCGDHAGEVEFAADEGVAWQTDRRSLGVLMAKDLPFDGSQVRRRLQPELVAELASELGEGPRNASAWRPMAAKVCGRPRRARPRVRQRPHRRGLATARTRSRAG